MGNLNSEGMMVERAGKTEDDSFSYFVEQFDDIRVLKYRLKDFDSLSLNQKKLLYFLGQAALSGRDIVWDQNFRYNLIIRKTLEGIIKKMSPGASPEYDSFMVYARKVFFANGIHHHYSSDKFRPGFSVSYFRNLVNATPEELLPLSDRITREQLLSLLIPVIFDESLYPKKVDRSEGTDIITGSAVNFYEGVTLEEVEYYYASQKKPGDIQPIASGLNSRLVKANGRIFEEVYRSGGKYGRALDAIIKWLQEALCVAENDAQKEELALLIEFYRSGDLHKWDEYNIKWAGNTGATVDYINGFIEVYEDPLGIKATWESVVQYIDAEATRRTGIISGNAQWFEDHSPVDPKYRKEKVTGIAARVIDVAMLGGDCYPASPLGINLPNSNWIRKEIGSKSVTLANITSAIEAASLGNGFLEEFAADDTETARIKKYGPLADALHTDLHECIGHASGKLADGTDPNALKSYYSPLEEARADLFALYYIYDDKMIELGLVPDKEAARASYDTYIRNGLLTQIVRIKPGKKIEEAHMRNRAAITRWVYEHGRDENVIEIFNRNGKTFVRINDYGKLRMLFGLMLKEVQRIKSEGDYDAGRKMIEDYGVRIDPLLHREILERYARLNLAPYTGFINPILEPQYDKDGEIADIKVVYQDDFLGQAVLYGDRYSFLSPEI